MIRGSIVATSRIFPNSENITDEWAAMIRDRGIKLFRQDESGAVELKFFRSRLAGPFLFHRRDLSQRESVNGEAAFAEMLFESRCRQFVRRF